MDSTIKHPNGMEKDAKAKRGGKGVNEFGDAGSLKAAVASKPTPSGSSTDRDRLDFGQNSWAIPSNVAEMRERRKMQKEGAQGQEKITNQADNVRPTAMTNNQGIKDSAARSGLAHTRMALDAKVQAFGGDARHVPGGQKAILGGQASLSPSPPLNGLSMPPPSITLAHRETKRNFSVCEEITEVDMRLGSASCLGPMSAAGEEIIENVAWKESSNSRNGQLVEARAINESQINLSLPHAQEVDIDQSRTKHGNGRSKNHHYLLLIGLVLMVVVVVVVIVVAVTSSKMKNDDNGRLINQPFTPDDKSNITITPTTSPSFSPSDFSFAIQELPKQTVEAISRTGSAQQRAYDWTFNHPEFDLMPNWRKKQLLALASFYYSLNGEAWENKKNWMDYTDECYWYTDLDSPDICFGDMCGYPQKYHYSGSVCSSASGAVMPPPPDPYASNCNSEKRLQFLKWANIGVLQGTLPPEFFFLTGLTTIDLGETYSFGNRISGSIPTEIGMLTLLNTLDLSGNMIQGSIPSEIGMTNLTNGGGNDNGALSLHRNNLTGTLPSELGLLTNLKQINIQDNQLTGPIPSEIGNLHELSWFEAQKNFFSLALPSELGVLSKLQFLDLSDNLISSSIPSEIGLGQYLFNPDPSYDTELAGIPFLDLSSNLLSGTVPAPVLLGDQIHLQQNLFSAISTEIGILPSPSRLLLDLGNNRISTLPSEIFLFTTLQMLSLAGNQILSLPSEVGQMGPRNDYDSYDFCALHLDLSDNHLKSLPSEIGKIPALRQWMFRNNQITDLPSLDWANLTQVLSITLSQNRITTIPMAIFMMTQLIDLELGSNLISGRLPFDIFCGGGNSTSCAPSLGSLNLSSTLLQGPLPNALRYFTSLSTLDLSSNLLTGTIHTYFGTLSSLRFLVLSNNQLSGGIPSEIGNVYDFLTNSTLQSLILTNNSLTGIIPSEVGLLTSLAVIDFSSNTLRGSIPLEISQLQGFRTYYDFEAGEYGEDVEVEWSYLDTLNLSHNTLTGSIPTQIGTLTNLQLLDLSFNKLTGAIPSELGLLNASRLEYEGSDRALPATSKIVLQGNTFNGRLPRELCPWYCNKEECPNGGNMTCYSNVLLVDCYPVSLLDCSLCAC